MSEQPELPYGGSPPFQAHSQTSKAASDSVRKKIGPLHKEIIDYLAAHGGATDEQMQFGLGMVANTQRPRRRELQLMGIIEDSGKLYPTRSNREAVVWRLRSAA